METQDKLKASYGLATVRLAQHGIRNVGVLQEAIKAVDPTVETDVYGSGEIITGFEEKIAKILGTEAATFYPSGTMAQQIALRCWADEKGSKKIAYHPLAHLEIHEADGLKELHQIETILLGDGSRIVTLADIQEMDKDVAAVLLELPQREIGGQLPNFAELVAISTYCRQHDIALHLDGARLWEVLPYYERSAAEICALFDSVYVSMYKGIGGVAGAVLAGSQAFIDTAKVWKQRYGGNLISLSPYILAADYYFDDRIAKMPQYYRKAQQLATYFNACVAIETIPKVPVSNMFHVHFNADIEQASKVLIEIQDEMKIGITGYLRESNHGTCFFELSVGDSVEQISEDRLITLFDTLNTSIAKIKIT